MPPDGSLDGYPRYRCHVRSPLRSSLQAIETNRRRKMEDPEFIHGEYARRDPEIVLAVIFALELLWIIK